jgi:hypothetical protein
LDMSALQIAAMQRVCRGLVSLPQTQLGNCQSVFPLLGE